MADSRINWVDSLGNIRLTQWPNLIVERRGLSSRPGREREFRWNPSAVDIAEWILSHPGDRLTVSDMAARLRWSNPQVSRVAQRVLLTIVQAMLDSWPAKEVRSKFMASGAADRAWPQLGDPKQPHWPSEMPDAVSAAEAFFHVLHPGEPS